jgi:hypothetical protein
MVVSLFVDRTIAGCAFADHGSWRPGVVELATKSTMVLGLAALQAEHLPQDHDRRLVDRVGPKGFHPLAVGTGSVAQLFQSLVKQISTCIYWQKRLLFHRFIVLGGIGRVI